MTEIIGPHGRAHRVARANYRSAHAELDGWIITAPTWHPLWSQYTLNVMTLADMPGVPAATRQRPGVTHELLVAALDPVLRDPQGAVVAVAMSLAAATWLAECAAAAGRAAETRGEVPRGDH
ncbi:hypothetical protein [Sphaerisporangium sp. TRM90804]|uniref:hypothetical protein n=1 Tax=Sphaerisporangium sp. TRM90804 TaxID=3031113 RepID=UPI002448DF7D|nr:hypothetical protein [Sphaerisporangium sp. TRM90804]MDH2425757.1 hypothetical protein [Sphaerisporangium sp. TRM90804]